MPDTALVIGGTRFVGRHTVEELLDNDYRVTTFTRGQSENPFTDHGGVGSVHGDRTDREALEEARESVDPSIVIDTCAYHPGDVATATEVFADADAYVYVSSGSAYDAPDVPMREGETALHECTAEQATDDSTESYGPRKAEGDRVVASAAEDGVRAMAVRPMLVYGPHDYTERFAYWTDRVAEYDAVAVPFDGGSLLHRSYVADVASALRIVAERGTAGEAYNVADRNTFSLSRSIELVAAGLDTEVEIVQTGPSDLAAAGVEPTAFPLYTPQPALAATGKLAALGWESTDPAEAVATTARAHREHGRDGVENGPDRETEEALIDAARDDP
ncbi:MAG: NAD-dependent epimerase/dehydratase family protein [Halolamina sp.]